jgi:hypothetical protein
VKPTVKDIRALARRAAQRVRAAIWPHPSKAEREAGIEAARQARRDAEAQLAYTRQAAADDRRRLSAAMAAVMAALAEDGHDGTHSGGAR